MNTNLNAAIVAAAERHLGTKEWPGAKSNPVVEMFFARAGFPGTTDDVPWCAAFVGSVLAECGIIGSGSLMARSYLKWGCEVSPQDAGAGCVAVVARGKPPFGHVLIVTDIRDGEVYGVGGNQSDAVTTIRVPVSSVLGFRTADTSARPDIGRATVRRGSRGAMVLDLQDQLKRLRYFPGVLDGVFGDRTRSAVLDFQASSNLDADGVVGPDTWTALENAVPRPGRNVTEDDLRARGATTLANTDLAIVTTVGAGVVEAASVIAENLQTTADSISQAQGALGTAQGLLLDNWPVLLVIALLGVGIYAMRKVAHARVADAQSGAHMGR